MKTILYFNEKLDKADKEFISDMIRDHLADMEVSPCSLAMKFTLLMRRINYVF